MAESMLGPVIRGNPNKYLAQVFQALRIEVNDELGALKEFLQQAPEPEAGRKAERYILSLPGRQDSEAVYKTRQMG